MGYETDFITGRAINRQDKAVAVVIIQTTGGYPDAEEFAAKGPVYPNDRFEPLSLPLKGKLDEHGFFTPEGHQIGLEIFESFMQMPWSQFREKVLNNDEAKVTRGTNPLLKKTFVPGLAIMHESTASALAIGRNSSNLEDAKLATEIVLDADIRNRNGEWSFYGLSQLWSGCGRPHVTLSGKTIKEPDVLNALADGDPSVLGPTGRESIRDFLFKSDTIDPEKLTATLESLAAFQKMQKGMRVMRRYWQPSAFSRSDNLLAIARFNIRTTSASLKDLTMRDGFDPDNEKIVEQLDQLSEMLRKTLETIEMELEIRNSKAPAP